MSWTKEQYKAYYQAHKEEKKAYYQAHKEEKKAYYQAHKEQHKEDLKAYYQAHKEENKAKKKAYYQAHKEQRKAYRQAHKEQHKEDLKAYYQAHKEQVKAYTINYMKNDVNAFCETKNSIRQKSRYILKKSGIKIPDYEIHHCFTYDDPSKFIYCSREIHLQIHQFLRDNNIDADSNHYEQIKHLLDEKVVTFGL